MRKKLIKVQLGFNISKSVHTLYHSFFNNPPEGIEYHKAEFKIINKKNYSFLGKIYKKMVSIFPFISLFHQNINDFLRKEAGNDLIHFTFHLGNTRKKYVIDYETAYSFINKKDMKNKRIKTRIIKKLNKKNLKYLLPIHEEALKSFKLYFGTSVKTHQEIIYPTIFIPKENREFVKKENRVVFISTSNILTEDVFLIKGGLETLKAFEKLAKKYPKWEFLILGKVPKYLEKKFPKNLLLKEGVSREIMWDIFNKSKIFVQPCYQAPAMAFLEAMWFKLPIITYDCWGNPEYVDGKNGIVLHPENINHIDKNNVPNYTKEVLEKIKQNSNINSEKLIKAVEKLMKDEKLRQKLGENGFEKVLNGKFAIEKRNKQLRKIYDKALE